VTSGPNLYFFLQHTNELDRKNTLSFNGQVFAYFSWSFQTFIVWPTNRETTNNWYNNQYVYTLRNMHICQIRNYL